MGNLPSQLVEEDEVGDFELEKAVQKGDVSEREENLFDFSILFNTDALHKAIVSIKEAQLSDIQKKKSEIEQWIKNLIERDEKVVSIAQFVDFLTSKNIDREEAVDFFNELDLDGDGSVETTFLLQILQDKKGSDLKSSLIPCHILPSSLDTYLTDKSSQSSNLNLGHDIVKFLRQRRVNCSYLSSPVLTQFVGIIESRERLINGRYMSLKDNKDNKTLADLRDSEDDEGQQCVVMNTCYSTVSVSSNQRTGSNLIDKNFESYWQSNGPPRSHWIRIHMLPGISLKDLSIGLCSSDDSYMPKSISVSIGNAVSSLKEVKTYNIPREHNGKFQLLGSLNSEYRYIQINIRGCHSDGCDTRIREVHVRGYKYKRQDDPSVMDGLVMFYLNLITAVIQAALPLTPSLRDTILMQSKQTLNYLPPLSLSKTSPRKPEFLSTVLTGEMNKFIRSLCLPGENFVSVDVESMSILLRFAMTTGNLNDILDILQILMDNTALELPLQPFMEKLIEIENLKYKKHAPSLKLTVVKCDSETEEGKLAQNMFTNEPSESGVPFKTVKGKKVVNIIIKAEDQKDDTILNIVKLHIKVANTDSSARSGLLFVFDSDHVDSDSVLEDYAKYDSFTKEDWEAIAAANSQEVDQTSPVVYFEPPKEWQEIELDVGVPNAGKYILIKLFAQESSEQISINYMRIKGYSLSQHQLNRQKMLKDAIELYPLPSDPYQPIGGSRVLLRMLVFLCRMLQDLNMLLSQRSVAMLDPEGFQEGHITTEDLSLEKIWNLYIPLTLIVDDSEMEQCSLVCLTMLRQAIPFIKATPSNEQGNAVPSAVLSHLCSLMDNPSTESFIKNLTQEIIRDGVVVFFPGAKARRKYLLEMVELVLTGEQPVSWWLKFEALCGYFSKASKNSLLELPWEPANVVNFDIEPAMNILSTVLSVATKEASNDIAEGNRSHPDDLVRLLCAMQSHALYWVCHNLSASKQLDDKWDSVKDIVHDFLLKYVDFVVDSCRELFQKIQHLETIKDSILDALRRSLVGQLLPEMIAFLGSFISLELPVMSLLQTFKSLISIIQSSTDKLTDVFTSPQSVQSEDETEKVLAVWTRESPHNYENNSKINEDFVCPGAEKFVVEFDSRCRTERRYDYIRFTDSTGDKKVYDDSYGSDHWPSTNNEFKGPKLNFYFYSDGSNNYWGYKFTIKAYGKGIPPLHWLHDMYISLSRVAGLLLSNVLGTRDDVKFLKSLSNEEQKEVDALLRSDFWKTLLRGGYQVGKLTRSLSGAHATSPVDSSIYSYLHEMTESEEVPPLIEICRAKKGGISFGGPLVDKAVTAVFAALIWHSQELREDLSNRTGTPKATPGIMDAFAAAEGLRRELVESRQKLIEQKEKLESEQEKDKINEDQPIMSCLDKAMYLMKFAGLSRVTWSHDDRPDSPIAKRPSWGQKSFRWQRVSSVVSTVSRIKQQVSKEGPPLSLAEKHPSFDTVLTFVRNDVLTQERVHDLIQRRSRLAQELSAAYTIAAEILHLMTAGDQIQTSLLGFIQNLLVYQRKFPQHYGARLDGCGLDLETQLRRSFQRFVHSLLDAINKYKKITDKSQDDSVSVLRCILSHLLDICWQEYDYLLLRDIQFPDYLFDTTINSSPFEEKEPVIRFKDEETALERYKIHMRLLKAWKDMDDKEDQIKKFTESGIGQENLKETLLFLSLLSVNSQLSQTTPICDGCKLVLENENKKWYRDMEIEGNMNLCKECFFDGTGSRHDDYSLEHLFQELGTYECKGCGLAISSARFKNTSDDFDYCIGCFRKNPSKTIEWIVYLLQEEPATDKYNKYLTHDKNGFNYINGHIVKQHEVTDVVLYNQQHSWLLFSSLTLSMANNLSPEDKSKTNSDFTYQRYACELLMTCLKLISTGLKFSLAAALDGDFEKEEEKKEKTDEKQTAEIENPFARRTVETDDPVVSPADTTGADEQEATPQKDEQEESTPQNDTQDVVASTTDKQDTEQSTDNDNTKPQLPEEDTGAPIEGDTGAPIEGDTGTPIEGDTETPIEGDTGAPIEGDTGAPIEGQGDTGTPIEGDTGTPIEGDAETPIEGDAETPIEGDAETPIEGQGDTGAPIEGQGDTGAPIEGDTETPIEGQGDTGAPIEGQGDTGAPIEGGATRDEPSSHIEDGDVLHIEPLPSEGYLGRRMTGCERSFGVVFNDKLLGLLASLLPKELSLQSWINVSGNVECVIANDILPILFKLASVTAVGEVRQLQSVLVAAQYMVRISTEVADRAIEVYEDVPLDADAERMKTNGQKTTKYLFDLGATYLKESNISGAGTVAECLLLLSKSQEWKPMVVTTIGSVMGVAPDSLDHSGLFGLLLAAGFPKLLRVGSVVKWSKDNGDEMRGIVNTTPSYNDTQVNVVELKTRKPTTVKITDIEVEDSLKGCIIDSKLDDLLSLLCSGIELMDQASPRQVENRWILSLSLKSLSVLINNNSTNVTKSLLNTSILTDIVKLSCKPTQLNSNWKLNDLEVLGIMCYRPTNEEEVIEKEEVDGVDVKKDKKKQKSTSGDDKGNVDEKDEGEEPGSTPAAVDVLPSLIRSQSQLEEDAALIDLDDETKGTLKIMKEAFRCNLSLLRAMYESAGHEMEKFIGNTEKYYDADNACLKVPDELKDEVKKWEPNPSKGSMNETIQEYQDSQEDMGVTGFLSVTVDLKKIKATQESEEELKKGMVLIPKEKKEKKKSNVNNKEKSQELLQDELKKIKEDGYCNKDYMLKIHKAMIVLHSRQVLALLLMEWPQDGPSINTLLLGGLDISHWFSLLDHIVKGLPENKQEKLLRNVVLYSESTELISLALTAVQCMTDVAVARETVKFKYSTQNDIKKEDKVVLPNAAFLKVSMEIKRTFNGSIDISSDKEYTQYAYCHVQDDRITGTEKEEEAEHKIPGNTVYYRNTLFKQDGTSSCTGWSFKVTGFQIGRFNTSYTLLRILLGGASSDLATPSKPLPSLPLVQLWPHLIAAACELTGDQRLKVVGLMLQLLHLNTCDVREGAAVPTTSPKLDLTLLKPLWSLYTVLTKNEEKPVKNGSLKPEIVRGLTELFLIVENLAQEWGVEQDLMMETISEETILKWFGEGVCNIGYVSLSLGLTNTITETLIESKKNYVPPPVDSERVYNLMDDHEEQTSNSFSSSSSSTTSDSDSSSVQSSDYYS